MKVMKVTQGVKVVKVMKLMQGVKVAEGRKGCEGREDQTCGLFAFPRRALGRSRNDLGWRKGRRKTEF